VGGRSEALQNVLFAAGSSRREVESLDPRSIWGREESTLLFDTQDEGHYLGDPPEGELGRHHLRPVGQIEARASIVTEVMEVVVVGFANLLGALRQEHGRLAPEGRKSLEAELGVDLLFE